MYQSILVPLDGSTFAEHALPYALALARRGAARLTLATVSTPLAEAYVEGLYFSAAELEQEIEGRHRDYLDAVAKRVSAKTSVPVTTEVRHGEVAESLAAAKADLVVMATHGRGAIGRFWLGSVADEMIRRSGGPLLLIRPGQDAPDLAHEPGLARVVLALDGSEHAEHILRHSERLTEGQPDAEVVLLRAIHAVAPTEPAPEGSGAEYESRSLLEKVRSLQAKLRNEAELYLEKVAEPLRARGLKVRTDVLVEDDPAKAILREAEATRADLIGLETHGRSGLSRLVRGSVADKVIRAAHRPVLIHRSPAN
jgi:nucleotide-binding universal stress UspA family protein